MAKIILDFEKPIFELEEKIEQMRQLQSNVDIEEEIKNLQSKIEQLKKNIYSNLTRWQKVQLARHPERPYTIDFINMMTTDFIELHGDRLYGDDKAIIGGFAMLENQSVMIVGQQKGRDTKSNVYRNFGMPNPEGYRKALRLFRMAERFNKPIITFLDTPGAFPGIEAEERGQGEAIAKNIFEMSHLKVPVIVVIIGEGASGGALGIGVGDRMLMLENAWYTVISPESCSSILWRSWEFKEQAAESLQLTAKDLISQKIIDRIVPEPLGGSQKNPLESALILKKVLIEEIKKLQKIKPQKLVNDRISRYSKMGHWSFID